MEKGLIHKILIKIIVFLIILSDLTYFAQNSNPIVDNVSFTQRMDGSYLVDIYYDVNDPDGDKMTITMQVSDDNGITWNFNCSILKGDIGTDVSNGTNNHIVWDFGAEHPNTSGNQFRVKIIANDGYGGAPCKGAPTVVYGGITYNTVQIGRQCWLKENLNVGDMIDNVASPENNDIIEKYCYSNDLTNCSEYGALYTWNEAMKYNYFLDPFNEPCMQGICPFGWYIPTMSDIDTLIKTVGGSGNALKALGLGIGDGVGTNKSGFSALLAGYRNVFGSFTSIGKSTYFWNSSNHVSLADIMWLKDNNPGVLKNSFAKEHGLSVRCLRDTNFIFVGKPCPGTPTVNYKGKNYNTVQIGDLCWLKENLNLGTMINVDDSNDNQTDNFIFEKYCYENDQSNCDKYGGLYQWGEAKNYSTGQVYTQGICPDGWHIPHVKEFQYLQFVVCEEAYKLKAEDSGSGTNVENNESGFSALLAGYLFQENFHEFGTRSYFLSSSGYEDPYAVELSAIHDFVKITAINKKAGASIRCVKD